MLSLASVSELRFFLLLFFFNDTPTTEIYTLSLHDALPISLQARDSLQDRGPRSCSRYTSGLGVRSEEHTSELQSLTNLVCRLLLEKKKADAEWTLLLHELGAAIKKATARGVAIMHRARSHP